MQNVTPNLEEAQEFWKPVVAPRPEAQPSAETRTVACGNCGNALVASSRFCPHCGTERQSPGVETQRQEPPKPGLAGWRQGSGWTIVSLALGCACLIAAAVTSYVFTATTLVDWQAIQLWRIEWLLAAIAILLAGILLKKK